MVMHCGLCCNVMLRRVSRRRPIFPWVDWELVEGGGKGPGGWRGRSTRTLGSEGQPTGFNFNELHSYGE